MSRSVSERFLATTIVAWALSFLILTPCWLVLLRWEVLHVEQDLYSRAASIVADELIRTEADPANIGRLFRWIRKVNPSLAPYLLAPDGRVVAAPDPAEVGHHVPMDVIDAATGPLWQDSLRCGPDPSGVTSCLPFSAKRIQIRGAENVLYLPVRGGLPLVFATPYGVGWALLHLIPVFLASLSLAFAIGGFGFQYLTRALRALADTVARHRAGDFAVRWPILSNDEIGTLGLAFNSLADTVDARRAQREVAVQRQGRLLGGIVHDFLRPVSVCTVLCDRARALAGREYPEDMRRTLLSSLEAEEALLRQISEYQSVERQRSPVSLHELLQRCAANMRPLFESKGVMLHVEAMPSEVTFSGRPQAIYRVLQNLIDNGLRYTPAGGTVCARTDFVAGFCLFEVSDTGVGIPADELDRIGTAFYRVQHGSEEHPSGAGLGMSTVREIVEEHRGAIQIRSAIGAGTTVRCSFPIGDNPFTSPDWKFAASASSAAHAPQAGWRPAWRKSLLVFAVCSIVLALSVRFIPEGAVVPGLVVVCFWASILGGLLAANRSLPGPIQPSAVAVGLPLLGLLLVENIGWLWVGAIFSIVAGFCFVQALSRREYRPLSIRLATVLFFSLYSAVIAEGLLVGVLQERIVFGPQPPVDPVQLGDIAQALNLEEKVPLSPSFADDSRGRVFFAGALNPHLELYLRCPPDQSCGDSPMLVTRGFAAFPEDWRSTLASRGQAGVLQYVSGGFQALLPVRSSGGPWLFVRGEGSNTRLAVRRVGERYLLWYFIFSQLVLLFVGAVVRVALDAGIGRRLERVRRAVLAVEAGSWTPAIVTDGGDEIEQIASVVPELVTTIGAATQALEQLETRTSRLLDASRLTLQSRVDALALLIQPSGILTAGEDSVRKIAELTAGQAVTLNSVLDLSKLEQGVFELKSSRFFLEDLVFEATLSAASTFSDIRRWSVAHTETDAYMVEGDFSLLVRALAELLRSFTIPGSVGQGELSLKAASLELSWNFSLHALRSDLKEAAEAEQTVASYFAETAFLRHGFQVRTEPGRFLVECASCVLVEVTP